MREHRKRRQTGHRATSMLPSERVEFGFGQGLSAPTQVNVGFPTFTVLRQLQITGQAMVLGTIQRSESAILGEGLLPFAMASQSREIGNKSLCRSRLSDFDVGDTQTPWRRRAAGPYTRDVALSRLGILEGRELAAALASDAAPALLHDDTAEQIDGRIHTVFARDVARRIDSTPQSRAEKIIGHLRGVEQPRI